MSERITSDFFRRDVLNVAPELLGKVICRKWNGRNILRYSITEVEAYRGQEDLACHACKGRTKRNRIMYEQGGSVYMYLIYGMCWMLNIVTGDENQPQAVLIRGVKGFEGPGKLTREMKIDGAFYGEDLQTSQRIWIEKEEVKPSFIQTPRIGIDYAEEPWKSIPWRFMVK